MSRKPNVILIMADDLGYGDIGCFNYGLTDTPRLDSLISEGILLPQHYSASPLCAPARAAMLTGRYPQRTGVIDTLAVGGLDRMSLRETTIAEIFRDGGYRTGLTGKWHCGAGGKYNPFRRGFQECWWFSASAGGYFDWTIRRNETPQRADGRYLTDAITDEAIAFMQRRRDEPFFLHVAHWAPHAPLEAPQEDLAFVKAKGGEINENVQTIYAMVRALDRNIGRLLDELKTLGLEDNTIVLFTSDNGPQFGCGLRGLEFDRFNCGLRGAKGTVYDGGIRVPGVIRWPGGLPGGVTRYETVHFCDWLVTLLDLCGLDQPSDIQLDGRVATPILRGESGLIDPVRFWQWSRIRPNPGINAAMRGGDWKLVMPGCYVANQWCRQDAIASVTMEADIESFAESYLPVFGIHAGLLAPYYTVVAHDPQLFNIQSDPQERFDLAEAYPQRVAAMRSELNRWFDSVDADLCAINEPGKQPPLPLQL